MYNERIADDFNSYSSCLISKELYRFAPEAKQDAMLSQGEPRDATVIFDTTASCMRLLWYSMGFLYRPTSAQQPFKC